MKVRCTNFDFGLGWLVKIILFQFYEKYCMNYNVFNGGYIK